MLALGIKAVSQDSLVALTPLRDIRCARCWGFAVVRLGCCDVCLAVLSSSSTVSTTRLKDTGQQAHNR